MKRAKVALLFCVGLRRVLYQQVSNNNGLKLVVARGGWGGVVYGVTHNVTTSLK